jgi:long-chain acyl-CoA synthetase
VAATASAIADASDADTVTAPLARWARTVPGRIAIDDGTRRLDFAALACRVDARAARLNADGVPSIAWAGDGADGADGAGGADGASVAGPADDPAPDDLPADSLVGFLVDFLAIAGSGRAAAVADPDWPPAVRADLRRIVAAGAGPAGPATASGDFYLGFTSGSTGRPKGFVRSHASWSHSFRACLDAFGDGAAQPVLAPGRPSHSLFLFGMLLGLWTGAGVTVQPRFSAQRTLDTLRAGAAGCLVAVPSQLLLMLDLARRRGLAPVPGVRLVMISGARWMRHRTPALRALLPGARIVEFYGASETSFVAWTDADPELPDTVAGRPFAGVEVRIAPLDGSRPDARPPAGPPAAPESPDALAGLRGGGAPCTADGLIYLRSPMVFRGYVEGTADAATGVLRDGDWLSVRDVGRLDADGWLHLRGRAQRMLVTRGKNVFAEEIERVLCAHPAVRDASVHGLPDPLRGLQLAAVVALQDDAVDGGPAATASALAAWCRARLEPYKVPRRWWRTAAGAWPTTPGGKTDHARLAAWLDAPQRRAPAGPAATAGPHDIRGVVPTGATAAPPSAGAAGSPPGSGVDAGSAPPPDGPWLRPLR